MARTTSRKPGFSAAVLAAVVLLAALVAANPVYDANRTHGHSEEYFQSKTQQAMEPKSPNGQPTIVHIIAHSHDDVGWLKTLYQYFWGIHDDVQRANVMLIIDSSITELEQNPERKFTYVEMAFFMRWWELQTDKKKEQVRNLIREGRLEIVNAGWSMNDEACPYYTQIIENMMIGHKFLKEELGITTNIGWHLDPFGHSSANAAMFADMGIDAFFYSRLDYQDKAKRLEEKSMEYVWRPFPEDRGNSAEIFTHAMFDHYYPPPGFCWATSTCGYYDEPIVHDKKLKTFNFKERIAEMYEWVSHMKDHYRTNHLLVPMGGDFFYKNAHKIFINTDRLIKYFNEEYDDFKLVYSTPSNYLKAVHDSGKTFPVKYDDQFPYAEKAFSYWSGYFSSRAVSKGNIREFDRFIELENSLWTNYILNKTGDTGMKERLLAASEEGLRVVGVMQHHDAVTGTERQHVADDYQQQIDGFYELARNLTAKVFKNVIESKFGTGKVEQLAFCKKAEDGYTQCPQELFDGDRKNSYIVIVKNSNLDLIKIKLPSRSYKIVHAKPTENGDTEPKQTIFCEADGCRLLMQDHQAGLAVYKLVSDLESKYLAKQGSCNRIRNEYQSLMLVRQYENSVFLWYVSCDTPREDPMFGDKTLCGERNISVSLRNYPAYQANDQPSGAYVFRPENGTVDSQPYGKYEGFSCYNESDWLQTFEIKTDKSTIYLRIAQDDNIGLQVETHFNGIELSNQGSEVTLNIFALGFNNSGEFYTDSNGLQMQKRVVDQRPTWKLEIQDSEHISANYYPINSVISMVDSFRGESLSYLNDRSMGGSALKASRLEVMIDRRLYYDDFKGLEEALNETDHHGNPLKVTTNGYILLERSRQAYATRYGHSRIKSAQHKLEQTTETSVVSISNNGLISSIGYELSSMQSVPIPSLKVYPVAFDEIIVRVGNPEDYFTNPNITYVQFDIEKTAIAIYQDANGKPPKSVRVEEVTLSASETIAEREKHRLKWIVEEEKTYPQFERKEGSLFRQEMRTFRVKYVHYEDDATLATS